MGPRIRRWRRIALNSASCCSTACKWRSFPARPSVRQAICGCRMRLRSSESTKACGVCGAFLLARKPRLNSECGSNRIPIQEVRDQRQQPDSAENQPKPRVIINNMKPEPFRIEPVFLERIWGARSLAPLFPAKKDLPAPIGETWLTGYDCRIET